MEPITVPIIKLPGNDDLPLPCYMTERAAGMDLSAAIPGEITLRPGGRVLIPTGIALALPAGYEAQLRPRSGLAWKMGVTILNSPGTIDADYRGEIMVILINHGDLSFSIKRGDRIAQLVVHAFSRVSWRQQEVLDDTDRGAGGFGHTN